MNDTAALRLWHRTVELTQLLHLNDVQRITEKQNKVVITDRMWARLLSSTNQPSFLGPKDVAEAIKDDRPATGLLEGDNPEDNHKPVAGKAEE